MDHKISKKFLEKVEIIKQKFQNGVTRLDKELVFELGNCQVQQKEFDIARSNYNISLQEMLGKASPFWKLSNQPNWLLDVWILSGRMDLYAQVAQYFEPGALPPTRGERPFVIYGRCVFELLFPQGKELEKETDKLIRIKDTLISPMGSALSAIEKSDWDKFNCSMEMILKAHEGMAKFGGLRYTAEGLVCMQGMTLAYVAKKRGGEVRIENLYLPLGYLDYLIEKEQS